MPNSIKYSTSAQTLALKKGNFWIGTGDVGKGPTESTGYYNGVTPGASGYTIYVQKTGAPGELSYGTAANDSELVTYTNSLASTSYTTAAECLVYFAGQTDKTCVNRDYEPIVTNGLVLNLDAGFTPSYPTSGTTWYDVQGTNNGTLTNSPGYDNEFGGEILFDGVDDFVSGAEIAELGYTNNYTVIIWLNNNNGGYVMSNKSNVGERFGININSAGTVSGFFYNGSVYTTVGRVTRFGAWEQVVVVNQSQQLTMYVSMNKSTTGGSAIDPGNNGLRIGRRNRTSELYFNGRISQVQVYNRAMTESEILYNYQSMLPRFIGENIVTNGLVFYVDAGYYTSYPQTGTTWYDVSGYNNNGTLVNGPTYSSSNGGVIILDGIDDRINAPSSSVYDFTNNSSFTLETFCYATTQSSSGMIPLIERYSTATGFGGYALRLRNYSTNYPEFVVVGTPSGSTVLDSSVRGTTQWVSNTWYHIVGTKSTDGVMKIYVNGVLEGTTTGVTNIPLPQTGVTLKVGARGDTNDQYSNQRFGICRIYNRALSGAEVLQNYNAQKSRFGL